jgi:deazaflavin-dependent oxidoreductase (nitroreductase family)
MEWHAIINRLAAVTEGLTRPVHYADRTRYRRPPALYRHLQWLGILLVSYGLAPTYVITLEVRGRRTGKRRRTVLVQTTYQGERYVVALAGESEWVRNLRAAAGRAVIRRGSPCHVRLVEVPTAERPPILRAYLGRGGRLAAPIQEARYYFGVDPDPSPEELRAVAA